MRTRPYDYQIIGARRIAKFGGRALLADSMGLGKSLQILLHLDRHPELRPAVVVCPAGLKYNWEAEAARHLGMRAQVLEGTRPPARLPRVPSPLYVASYNILGQRGGEHSGPGWGEWLAALGPEFVALDECQAVSNRSALQTKWTRKLCRGVPQIVGISGTPLTNRPNELFSVLNIIRPDLFPSFVKYAERYCPPQAKPWGVTYDGAANLGELHAFLTEHLMIRRRKEDVLRELPTQRRQVVTLPLSDPQEYAHAHRDFLTWLAKHMPERVFRASKAQRLTQVGYLKRLAGKLKLRAVTDWVDSFLSGSDGKLVLFAVHVEVLDALEKRYRKVCVRVDGSTPPKERQRAQDAFQARKSLRVYLANIDAGGKGTTLTAARTVAFAELGWTPGAHAQAEKRIDRIGQTAETEAVYLVARGTLEEKLVKLIQEKSEILSAVLDGGEYADLDIFDILCRELAGGAA